MSKSQTHTEQKKLAPKFRHVICVRNSKMEILIGVRKLISSCLRNLATFEELLISRKEILCLENLAFGEPGVFICPLIWGFWGSS